MYTASAWNQTDFFDPSYFIKFKEGLDDYFVHLPDEFGDDLNTRCRVRILNGIYYIKAKNEEILTTNLIRIPKEVNRKGRYQKPIRTRIFRTTFFNFESYAFSCTRQLILKISISYFDKIRDPVVIRPCKMMLEVRLNVVLLE